MFGDFSLENKIVVVTGGASGIGLAFVEKALSSNARVVIADLEQSDAVKRLDKAGADIRFKQCDVRRWSDLESLVPFSKSEFGDVPDVFAANAGVNEGERNGFWSECEDTSYSLLDINLGHAIKLTRIAIRTFVQNNKKGVVLVTSSIAGTNGHLGTPIYVASKHGTLGFVKSLAKLEELANVKVIGICPGLVETPLLLRILGEHQERSGTVLMQTTEIAARMQDLIEGGSYGGGTAWEVSKPGKIKLVADGSSSELEDVVPTSFDVIRAFLTRDKESREL